MIIGAIFLLFYFLPIDVLTFGSSWWGRPVVEALALAHDYARDHVLMCLVPAFFIAGAISVFIKSESVIKYLGAKANKFVAYGVASVSGSVLAVCSCTVLPLFAGIYRMGAGIGPATTFLYSGPAINVLAIILTARVLGLEMGIARGGGAVLMGIVIGLIMHLIFGDAETETKTVLSGSDRDGRPLWQTSVYFLSMIGILIFANWAKPVEDSGTWFFVYSMKWVITGVFALGLGLILAAWFKIAWWKIVTVAAATVIFFILLPGFPAIGFTVAIIGLSWATITGSEELKDWVTATWGFTKQITPLLFYGVLIAGALLGRPGHEGLIPSGWISTLVGGNSIFANLFASIVGAFMYFATLTEVPILQGLIGNGMGKGPALALLLAGPALSLPSMLVIKSIIGTKKAVVYISLVVVMSTITGIIYGSMYP